MHIPLSMLIVIVKPLVLLETPIGKVSKVNMLPCGNHLVAVNISLKEGRVNYIQPLSIQNLGAKLLTSTNFAFSKLLLQIFLQFILDRPAIDPATITCQAPCTAKSRALYIKLLFMEILLLYSCSESVPLCDNPTRGICGVYSFPTRLLILKKCGFGMSSQACETNQQE